MNRRGQNYEVKAIISCNKAGLSRQEVQETMEVVRKKLEHVIPGSYKARYVVNSEEVVIRLPGGIASEAMRKTRRVDDMIKHFLQTFKA